MSSADTTIKALLAQLWERNLSILHERLNLLDQAAASTALADPLKADARSAAHKLAGSLGMFGHNQATLIAQQLDSLLETEHPDHDRLLTLTTDLRQSIPGLESLPGDPSLRTT